MKKIFLMISMLICCPAFAFSPDSISTQAKGNIKILKNPMKLRGVRTVGNGGDEVGVEFEASFRHALANIEIYRITGLDSVTGMDFAEVLNELKIVVVETPLVVNVDGIQQDCVAVNYPLQNLIKINRTKWRSISDIHIKESIALHEMLSLLNIEQSGIYQSSSLYLAAFAQDPASVHKRYPVFTEDFEAAKIDDDSVSTESILGFSIKHSTDGAVSAKVTTVFVGGAAGISRIVLNLSDASPFGYGDRVHSVSYEISYVYDCPTEIKLTKIFGNQYLLTIAAKVVIQSSDGTYGEKAKTIKAIINLDANKAIDDVQFGI